MTRIHNESVWTTVVTIQVEDAIEDDVWKSILKESITFLHDVDLVFSLFREDSYLTRINRGHLDIELIESYRPIEFRHYIPYINETFTSEALVAFETIESLCAAAQWKTNGAFNAWRGESYDPIGLLKGWAADIVVDILQSYGIQRAFVNAGGDIAFVTNTEPWRVAIENPINTQTAIGYVEVTNGALCTSGNYRKGNHIQVKNPQNDFVSVTVSGPNASIADAYATAFIADGLVAFDWMEGLGPEWGVIAISDNTSIYTRNLSLESQYSSHN